MIGKSAALLAIGALCIAGQLSAKEVAAAQLSAIKGSVLVSQGGKMVPAAAGALRAGDRVVASNGSARLAYADGCVVSVPANGMATIAAASPCATGAGLISASQGASAQTVFGINSYIFYAAAIVGSFALVELVTNDDDNDDNGVSP